MEGAIEVPLFPYAHFQAIRVGTSKAPAHFVSLALPQESGGKAGTLNEKVQNSGEEPHQLCLLHSRRKADCHYSGNDWCRRQGSNREPYYYAPRLDDDDVDAQRREAYHCPVHLDGYHDGDGDDADDRNPYLEDDTYNPLQQILTSIANEERSVRMEKMKVALSELTDKQKDTVIKKFYRGMTNVQIAAEEGVSEAAIRNRLTKIYATLKKKI